MDRASKEKRMAPSPQKKKKNFKNTPYDLKILYLKNNEQRTLCYRKLKFLIFGPPNIKRPKCTSLIFCSSNELRHVRSPFFFKKLKTLRQVATSVVLGRDISQHIEFFFWHDFFLIFLSFSVNGGSKRLCYAIL